MHMSASRGVGQIHSRTPSRTERASLAVVRIAYDVERSGTFSNWICQVGAVGQPLSTQALGELSRQYVVLHTLYPVLRAKLASYLRVTRNEDACPPGKSS